MLGSRPPARPRDKSGGFESRRSWFGPARRSHPPLSQPSPGDRAFFAGHTPTESKNLRPKAARLFFPPIKTDPRQRCSLEDPSADPLHKMSPFNTGFVRKGPFGNSLSTAPWVIACEMIMRKLRPKAARRFCFLRKHSWQKHKVRLLRSLLLRRPRVRLLR